MRNAERYPEVLPQVRVPVALKRQLEEQARAQDRPLGWIIREHLRQAVQAEVAIR